MTERDDGLRRRKALELLAKLLVAATAAVLLLTATLVFAADATAVKTTNFTFGPQELR